MKKVLCIVLCLIMFMSNITTIFAAVNDYEDNWAKIEIEYMKNRGIVSGYPDGSFKPSNNMSKAEFYKVINRIMGFTKMSEISFDDVIKDIWYYKEVAMGVAAGYIVPAISLQPDSKITRGEVARIIGLVFSVEGDEQEANYFIDSDTIPKELKAVIGGLKKNGYINGYPDKSFRVNSEITRAEVVKMLYNIVGELVSEKGVYNKNAENNLVVNTTDVTLKDMEIGGNLYLAEGIGEGDATLDNVKVKNTIIVNGGGANSVSIKNSQSKNLLLDKKHSLVNVVLTNSKIDTFKNVNQVKLQLTQGSIIKNLELNKKAELIIDKSSLIERLIITGGEIAINAQGNVNYIKSSVKFTVNGEEAKANTEYKIVDGKLMLLNPSTGSGTYTPPPAPSVNKTALAAAIATAQSKVEANYTPETWQVFELALQYAVNIYNKSSATQAEVNNALNNLNTAMAGLREIQVYDDIENIKPNEDLTLWAERILEVSFNAPAGGDAYFRLSPTEAAYSTNNAMSNTSINMQEVSPGYYKGTWEVTGDAISSGDLEIEVNLVKDGVKLTKKANGIVHIVPVPEVEPSIAAFYEPTYLNTFSYIYVEVENLQRAAKFNVQYYIYGENNQPKLKETDITNLNEKNGMIYYNPNKINTINIKVYDQNENLLYTFMDVIPTLLGNAPIVDKTALVAAITTAQSLLEENYTPETWGALVIALNQAIVVNNDENATQDEVNNALNNLNAAINNLVEKPSGPAPTIVVRYYPNDLINNMVDITIELRNLSRGAKFDVIYNNSDVGGSPVISTSPITEIGESVGIWYVPNGKYKTITVRIYDINENLLHTFNNITPVKGN